MGTGFGRPHKLVVVNPTVCSGTVIRESTRIGSRIANGTERYPTSWSLTTSATFGCVSTPTT